MTFLVILLILVNNTFSLRNPIAVYCEYVGGKFYLADNGSTYCIINGIYFDAEKFYRGLEGLEYSLCNKLNLSPKIEYVADYPELHCVFPNGTQVLVDYLLPIELLQDLFLENKTCSNLLECQNEPWLYQGCSNYNYPCFDPPYIINPPNDIYYWRSMAGCYRNISIEDIKNPEELGTLWYINPKQYNLTYLYNIFIEKFCPSGKVNIECNGRFVCLEKKEDNEISQIMYNYTSNITRLKQEANRDLTGIIIGLITFLIGSILLIIYIVKKK